MAECFHCGSSEVFWQGDEELEDSEGNYLLKMYHCRGCGAEIEYYIPLKESENEDTT